jgi:class 3 adenylate cyclase
MRPALPRSAFSERTAVPATGDLVGDPVAVENVFAFVDISGFTSYCEGHGEHAAIEVLTGFRSNTRAIAVRRGVRVAKWLGDGVMLVSSEPAPLVAAVAELLIRAAARGIHTHAGMARGPVLLFEGDDYVGRTVNLAARLCDVATAGEVLCVDLGDELPDWVHLEPTDAKDLAGMGVVDDVARLVVRADVAAWFTVAA